jgi:WhiB family transcriptional regulator, redox-sensing transcriptional regulator
VAKVFGAQPENHNLVADPSEQRWQQMKHDDQEVGDRDMSSQTCRERLAVPCHVGDPDMWFADNPIQLEQAKALCADCPIRLQCLTEALEREEPWGVWGGEILDRGTVIARKRPRGRPRKVVVAA